MSQFKPYPAYKDSGVEWLGVVPEHWEVFPLKRDLVFLTSGSRGWAEHYSETGALFLRIGNLRRDSLALDLSAIQLVEVPTGAEGERTKVLAGDVLFSITAYLGSVAVVPSEIETAYVSQHVALARVGGKFLFSRWVGYVALSWVGKTYLESQGYGGTKIQLSLDDIANMVMTVPRPAEQEIIVCYLDHETTRIDALIEEQQRLIELLKEKRQAVISHAVTKGLDPSVPMKDSGVEWLGEVPAHWEIRKGGHIGVLFGSEAVPEEMVSDSGTLPFLKVSSLSEDTLYIRQWDFFIDDSAIKKYQPRNNFIVFPKRGAAIFLNKVNVVEVNALLDPNLMGWKIDSKNNAHYFAYTLKTRGINELADVSTVPQINNKHISPERFPVPPPDEQSDIVSFLDTEASQFDQLVAEAENGVSLLLERRSALISAAVTGKIDLRGWQPPADTPAPVREQETV